MALTPEEETARRAGFAMPEGNDYISGGDDAIRKNAVAAMDYARLAGIKERLPAGTTSFDELKTHGDYQLTGNGEADTIALESWPLPYREGELRPTAANISVRRAASGFTWQELRVWSSKGNKFFIRQSAQYGDADGTFGEWEEVLTSANVEETSRRVPVQLTTPRKDMRWTAYARNYRLPFKIPTNATKYRIHIANYNDADDAVEPAPNLRITQPLYIGEHRIENGVMTGTFTENPRRANSNWSINLPDNEEWVSEWINRPLNAGVEYLFSYSVGNSDRARIASGGATSWFSTDYSDAGRAEPTGTLNKASNAPLSIWLEIEAPHGTEIVAWIGDSLSTAAMADHTVYQSPAWLKARREGHYPIMLAQIGNRMEWVAAADDTPRFTRFADLGRANATIIQIGANDFYDLAASSRTQAEIVAEMQARVAAVIALARKHFSDDIYLATVVPRNTHDFEERVHGALAEYNEWLQGLPHGAVGCYDWVGAVSTADRRYTMDHLISSDLVHLNTAGYTMLSAAPLFNRPAAGGVAGVSEDTALALVQTGVTEAKSYTDKAIAAIPPAPVLPDTGWRDIGQYLSAQIPDTPLPLGTMTFRVRRWGNIVAFNVQGLDSATSITWTGKSLAMPPGFELSSIPTVSGSIAGIGGAQGLRWDKANQRISFQYIRGNHVRGESHFMVSSAFPDLNNLPGTAVPGS